MAEADLVSLIFIVAGGIRSDAAADGLYEVLEQVRKLYAERDSARAELARADRQTTPQVTLIACGLCGIGVQPRHAHRGLCPACLARELDRAEAEITRLRNRTTTEPR